MLLPSSDHLPHVPTACLRSAFPFYVRFSARRQYIMVLLPLLACANAPPPTHNRSPRSPHAARLINRRVCAVLRARRHNLIRRHRLNGMFYAFASIRCRRWMNGMGAAADDLRGNTVTCSYFPQNASAKHIITA